MFLKAGVMACLLVSARGVAAQDTPSKSIDPVPNKDVELTLVQEGTTYKLVRGAFYRVDTRSGRWDYVAEGYDLDYYKKNYVERGDVIFRKGDDGELYRVKRSFSDGFEDATSIRDLIGIERGWTTLTLQSPQTPTVADYVRLRKRILTEQADFLDNRVEPSDQVVHDGRMALKTYSVPRSGDMVTAKASLGTELLHFVRGDDVWYSGWYYVPVQSPMPFTLMDLETTWFKEHPGIRIMAFGNRHLGAELKWGTKPTFRQGRGKEIAFPRAQWVHVKFHITLSEKEGVVELWQDGVQIVSARGQTLPLPHTIYNSLEVGISAHSFGQLPATLYVDDVSITDHDPDEGLR